MKLARLSKSSNCVRAKRLKKGWKPADLAERAGLSKARLKAVESGKNPSLEEAARLSLALGLKVDSLFGFEFDEKAGKKAVEKKAAKKKASRSKAAPSKRALPLLTLMAGKKEPRIQKKVVRLVGEIGLKHLDETLAVVKKWKRKNPALVKKCARELRGKHKGDKAAVKRIRDALA